MKVSDMSNEQSFERLFLFSLFQAGGLTLFFVWFFETLLGSSLFSGTFLATSGFEYTLQVSNMGALALGICLSVFFSERTALSFNRIILAPLLILVLITMGLAVFEVSLPRAITFILGFLVNLLGGFLLVHWITILGNFSTAMTPFFIVLAVSFAVLIGFLLYSFSFYTVITIAALGGSIVVLIVLIHRHPIKENPVSKKESRERYPVFWKTRILFGIFGFMLGYALCIGVAYEDFNHITLALMIGALGAGIDIFQAGGVRVDRMRRVLAIGSILTLLVIIILWDSNELNWWCPLIALFSYAFTMQASWTVLSSRIFGINPLYMYVRGQRLFWILLAAGWCVAWLLSGESLLLILVSASIIAVILIMSLLFAHEDLENIKFISVGLKNPQEYDTKMISRFKKKCEALAATYELTSRETDVFVLMAKGYNAKSIGEELVISHYTAKTHIHHVYQKTGVSSRQAIIDLVERQS